MDKLVDTLKNYGISGEVVEEKKGPLLDVTVFAPAAGTKLKNIVASVEDIRRELGVASLRVEPDENSNAILFEMPRKEPETIDFKAILQSESFKKAAEKYQLPICLGVNIVGEPQYADLAKMPHLLVAGTTGSGKSVGLNTFVLSLVAARTPEEVKFVMVDPKKIEFGIYNNQKYLYTPVVTESADAVALLAYLAAEMDKRYDIFAESMSKNLAEYNAKAVKKMPYLVCVIDEFADLMATDKSVEKDVMRLAQKARAAGIHLILATQRPSVDVVTGVLKANFPTRIAYKTASLTDSRTILDAGGAENLIGRGDALFLASDGELKRVHGAYMSDEEIALMLKPYAAVIRPLVQAAAKEPQAQAKSVAKVSEKKEEKAESWFKKAFKIWRGLTVKDRELVIRALKYVFAFILGQIQGKSSKKK